MSRCSSKRAFTHPKAPVSVSGATGRHSASASTPREVTFPPTRLLLELLKREETPAKTPWWLILLGHEVGHHVQHDLLDDVELVMQFEELISTSIRDGIAEGSADEAIGRWSERNHEVFADAFAVFSMGAWAAWALGEITLDDRMLIPVRRYPAGAVRIALLDKLCRELGMTHVDVMQGLDPFAMASAGENGAEDTPIKRAVRADLLLVPAIANGILTRSIDGLDTLKALCGFSATAFGKGGEVDAWAKGFRGEGYLGPEKDLRSARLAISGAACAWMTVSSEADIDERETQRELLVGRVIDILPECAKPGTRSATETAKPDLETAGDKLADRLLAIDDEAFLDA